MAPRSRKSAQGRFFFSAAHVLGSASWLNRARVRNLFNFKQDPLIAEAPSQITSIQSSESRLIGTHEVEKACFSLACQIFFSNSTAQFYLKKNFFFFKYRIISVFFFFLNHASFHVAVFCVPAPRWVRI